jgi:hypothetical protein
VQAIGETAVGERNSCQGKGCLSVSLFTLRLRIGYHRGGGRSVDAEEARAGLSRVGDGNSSRPPDGSSFPVGKSKHNASSALIGKALNI